MASSGPPPDAVEAARRFDDTMARARAQAAAIRCADGELSTLRGRAQSPDGDTAHRRDRVLADLTDDLGRYAVPHGC